MSAKSGSSHGLFVIHGVGTQKSTKIYHDLNWVRGQFSISWRRKFNCKSCWQSQMLYVNQWLADYFQKKVKSKSKNQMKNRMEKSNGKIRVKFKISGVVFGFVTLDGWLVNRFARFSELRNKSVS